MLFAVLVSHSLLCLKLTWMRVTILMKGKGERVLTVPSQRENLLSAGQESSVFRLCDRLWEFVVWLVVWNLQQGWNRSTLNFQVQLCQQENIHKRKGMGRKSHHQSHSSMENVIVGGSLSRTRIWVVSCFTSISLWHNLPLPHLITSESAPVSIP